MKLTKKIMIKMIGDLLSKSDLFNSSREVCDCAGIFIDTNQLDKIKQISNRLYYNGGRLENPWGEDLVLCNFCGIERNYTQIKYFNKSQIQNIMNQLNEMIANKQLTFKGTN